MKVTYSAKANITHRTQQLEDGRSVEVISLTQAEHAQDAQLVLEWSFPILDIAGRWHPNCRFDRSIKADWSYGEKSMSAVSAPVISFFNEEGQNRGTFALSETLKEVRMSLGVHEEDGTMNCMIVVSLGALDSDCYELSLLCDDRNVRYEQAIREVGLWWEKDCGLHPASVPESAREPMYSFWYSYHQQFTDEEIEAECKRAKELGFGTVIVDDGWQTDDTNRGYGFCGDWKPAAGKIKDMRKHVEKVHQMGLKYLLWLSVPYVGIHSEMWKHFHNKLIGMDWQQNTGILDIRYPEVREYLSKVYADAVKDWDLDGLKLDFIDEFYQRKETPAVNDQMDCACIQQALDKLLAETMERLKKEKQDILIEFRQRYIGPSIRRYGNIFRVCDCPDSGISNRVGIVDLRLLSGNTAVHSDMLMWNKEEKAEIASLQVIDCLFGTMQFSVRLDSMKEEHKRMLKNYMAFMQRHQELLQQAPIIAQEPQNLYPQVCVQNERTEITALYSRNRVVELGDTEESIIVNGSAATAVFVESKAPLVAQVTVFDCMGTIVCSRQMNLSAVEKIICPIGGRVEIKSKEFVQ